MSDTIFSKIISGEIPSEFLYEDELCIAINDINPQAPVHVLVIPRQCIPRLVDGQLNDQALLGHLMLVAGKLAQQLGIGDAFRLVVNNGAEAGQTVFHLHLHIIGGRAFAEGHMAG
jgi:histidine triad (HIT) family protein